MTEESEKIKNLRNEVEAWVKNISKNRDIKLHLLDLSALKNIFQGYYKIGGLK